MKNQMAFLPVVLCGHLVFATTQDGGNGGLPVSYTPVKASRLQFRCLGRETKLGPLLLPQQITAAGQPLLAGFFAWVFGSLSSAAAKCAFSRTRTSRRHEKSGLRHRSSVRGLVAQQILKPSQANVN